jgi:NADP-dependent 3-hydroxy acid dehydrogenase YdfG
VVAGRRAARLAELAAELAGQTSVHPLVLDVRDRAAVGRGLGSLPADWREIDVLVNAAGLALGLEPAPEADLDQWETMVDTNVKGLLYVTRALLPGMKARDRGHIVNLGSVAGDWPYPGSNVYGATKAFVAQFSRNLRADLIGTRIRVTSVEPGLAETEFSLVRFGGDAERAAAVYRGTTPLVAEDVADIVLWVVSRPPHVNVNRVEVMPVVQAWGPLAVDRAR